MRALIAFLFSVVLGSAVRPPKPQSGRERAESDARVLSRLLGPERLAAYTGIADPEQGTAALAAERLAALEAGGLRATDDEVAVLTAPGAGERAGAALSALLRPVTLIAGIAFLGGAVVAWFGFPQLLVVSALGLAVGTLSLTAQLLVNAGVDRARVRPLLAWAAERPGQLGRGLPGPPRTRTFAGALDLLVYCLLVIVVGGAVMFIVIAVLTTGIELFSWAVDGLRPDDMGFSAVMLGLGVASAAAAWLFAAGWAWLARVELRRASAVEWLVRD